MWGRVFLFLNGFGDQLQCMESIFDGVAYVRVGHQVQHVCNMFNVRMLLATCLQHVGTYLKYRQISIPFNFQIEAHSNRLLCARLGTCVFCFNTSSKDVAVSFVSFRPLWCYRMCRVLFLLCRVTLLCIASSCFVCIASHCSSYVAKRCCVLSWYASLRFAFLCSDLLCIVWFHFFCIAQFRLYHRPRAGRPVSELRLRPMGLGYSTAISDVRKISCRLFGGAHVAGPLAVISAPVPTPINACSRAGGGRQATGACVGPSRQYPMW